MSYRGKILSMSPTGEGGRRNDYICTSHYSGHVEIVPAAAGYEGITFPPVALSGPGLRGVVYDAREDKEVIERVKARCASVVRTLQLGDDAFINAIFPSQAITGTLRGAKENLAKLESLDGDQPASLRRAVPSLGYGTALDRVFEEMFGGCEVVGVIQDSVLLIPTSQEPAKAMIGSHPDYRGKLVFIEVPLVCDDPIETVSGEYIVVNQSPDSLYVVKTGCCVEGVEVLRFPFANEEGHELTILSECEDDEFIQEFIERLDDMDTDNYAAITCDAAESASRQLKRMLEAKLLARAKAAGDDPLDRLLRATDKLFNSLGTVTGRMTTDDRIRCSAGTARLGSRNECCGCGCGG